MVHMHSAIAQKLQGVKVKVPVEILPEVMQCTCTNF